MVFSKIKHPKSFTQIAYNEIKKAIIDHTVAPGETLFERDLSDRLGISRTPIREAIHQLEIEGWLHSVPRKGIYIKDISKEEVEEVLQLRKANEMLVVELAIPNMTEQIIENINDICVSQQKEKGNRSFITVDHTFHIYLAEISGNKRLMQLMQTLSDQIHWFGVQALYSKGRTESILTEHGTIFQALKERDVDKAKLAVADHIEKTRKAILESLHKDTKQ